MADNERAHRDINWSDYERVSSLLRKANSTGDWDTADRLIPVVSELAEEIARNQDLASRRPDNSAFRKWDEAMEQLRQAQASGDLGSSEEVNSKVMALATVIDFIYGVDQNN